MSHELVERLRYPLATTVIARSTAIEDLELANEQRAEAADAITRLLADNARLAGSASVNGDGPELLQNDIRYHAEQLATYIAQPHAGEKQLASARFHNDKIREAIKALRGE